MAKSNPIELEIWESTIKDGEKTGYVHYVKGRPIQEIYDAVREALDAQELVDEYFSVMSGLSHEDPRTFPPAPKGMLWPEKVRWIACYAVTGGSEGHYVHVDVVRDLELDGKHVRTTQTIFIGKTFQGMEHAQKIANVCAEVLGV